MKTNRSNIINELSSNEDWDGIINFVEEELEEDPNNHWLLARIASAYYEKRDYDTAYNYISHAMVYQQDCPLVLWHLANIFRMQGRQKEAITIWEELINRGPEQIANDECGEGIDNARSLINDSRYMIGKTYMELNEKDLAKPFITEYHENINKGVESIYDPGSLAIL